MVVMLKLKRKDGAGAGNIHLYAFKTNRCVKALNMGSFDKDINLRLSLEELNEGTKMGIDSHADTTCVNKHAHIESIVEGFTVDAIPFDKSIGKLSNLPIVHAIYAHDNPDTMSTSLLRFNHVIYIKDMDNALLCPNQARENGIVVDDVPRRLDHTGTSTFSIITPSSSLPLLQNGPTAYLQLRRPTEGELNELYDQIIDVTDENGWDPYENENQSINQISTTMADNNIDIDIDDWLLNHHNRRINAMVVKPKDKLTPEYLAQIWKCGLETARMTIEASTCTHYRNVTKGLVKRFKPARDFMRYRQIRLPAGEFFTDTMMSKIRSVRGYTCAQIYGNKFGFIKAYPMDSHDK